MGGFFLNIFKKPEAAGGFIAEPHESPPSIKKAAGL
jgi:hypothetical protein